MPSGGGTDEQDSEADPFLRPLWAEEPEEAARPTVPPLYPPDRGEGPLPARRLPGHPRPDAAETLLVPLAAAQDALARLDARTEAAPPAIRQGMIGRLAFREAAGFLAARHAWVHPLDLALRAGNLAGRFDASPLAAGETEPDQPFGKVAAWGEPEDVPALVEGDQALATALGLARLLAALPRRHDPLADAAAAAVILGPLGVRDIDPVRFQAWRHELAGQPARPPLLMAARAAADWMERGLVDQPDAVQALAIAALGLARSGALPGGALPGGALPGGALRHGAPRGGTLHNGALQCGGLQGGGLQGGGLQGGGLQGGGLHVIPLPVWAAFPALGQGGTEALPRLQPAAALRLTGRSSASWTEGFLFLVAEAARAGVRELDRVLGMAEKGRAFVRGRDSRSRLPDTLDAVLAVPVLTAKALARRLRISPQAAARLLVTLAEAGIVREVTGRRSFRGFAIG